MLGLVGAGLALGSSYLVSQTVGSKAIEESFVDRDEIRGMQVQLDTGYHLVGVGILIYAIS